MNAAFPCADKNSSRPARCGCRQRFATHRSTRRSPTTSVRKARCTHVNASFLRSSNTPSRCISGPKSPMGGSSRSGTSWLVRCYIPIARSRACFFVLLMSLPKSSWLHYSLNTFPPMPAKHNPKRLKLHVFQCCIIVHGTEFLRRFLQLRALYVGKAAPARSRSKCFWCAALTTPLFRNNYVASIHPRVDPRQKSPPPTFRRPPPSLAQRRAERSRDNMAWERRADGSTQPIATSASSCTSATNFVSRTRRLPPLLADRPD